MIEDYMRSLRHKSAIDGDKHPSRPMTYEYLQQIIEWSEGTSAVEDVHRTPPDVKTRTMETEELRGRAIGSTGFLTWPR